MHDIDFFFFIETAFSNRLFALFIKHISLALGRDFDALFVGKPTLFLQRMTLVARNLRCSRYTIIVRADKLLHLQQDKIEYIFVYLKTHTGSAWQC